MNRSGLFCISALFPFLFTLPSQAQFQTPAAPQAPSANTSSEQTAPVLIVPENTLLRVRTMQAIENKHTHNGTQIHFMLSEDVLAIPRGAIVHGVVLESKKSGRLAGSPVLELKLTSLDLGGKNYPLYAGLFRITGTSKTETTKKDAERGAVVGAVVGASISGVSKEGVITDNSGKAASMLAGAAVGAGVGTLVAAGTPGPGVRIPAEAQVDFYLASPIAVTPVSAQEAARMTQGLRPGGPVLYLRGEQP